MMDNTSGIHPKADKVLVREIVIEEKTAGGIVLAKMTTEKEAMAEIHATYIEAGPIALEMHELVGVNAGDTILHTKFAGIRYRGKDGHLYRLIRAQDIMGVAEGVFDQKNSTLAPGGA